MSLIVLALLTLDAQAQSLPYTLEHPGFVLEWLPGEMTPPVEGSLGEEAGVISSGATDTGAEYHIRYRLEEVPDEGRAQWLESRLRSLLPPEALPFLLLGDVTWSEGGIDCAGPGVRSIGLVISSNYNIIDGQGSVVGRGRAYGAFRRGYSLFAYCLAPFESSAEAIADLERIIANAHLD